MQTKFVAECHFGLCSYCCRSNLKNLYRKTWEDIKSATNIIRRCNSIAVEIFKRDAAGT